MSKYFFDYSCISWTAERFDVTGNAAFIFFTGGYTGFFIFPPLGSATFALAVLFGDFERDAVLILTQWLACTKFLTPFGFCKFKFMN